MTFNNFCVRFELLSFEIIQPFLCVISILCIISGANVEIKLVPLNVLVSSIMFH